MRMRNALRLVVVGVVVSVLVGACAPVTDSSKSIVGPGFTLLSPNADTSVAPVLEDRTLEQAGASEADVNDELEAQLPTSLAPQMNAATQKQSEYQSYGLYQDGIGCSLAGHY